MAKKIYKALSHFEFMHNPEYQPKPISFADAKDIVSIVEDALNDEGRVVKKTTIKTVPAGEKFKGMKVMDFCMENLQAAGVVDKLKFTTIEGDIDTTIANVGKLAEAIENNNEEKNEE